MDRDPKSPILPSDFEDPTGVDRVERGAINEFGRRLKRVKNSYRNGLNRIPGEAAPNGRYTFRLDSLMLRSLLNQLDMEVDSILLEGGEERLWLFERFVSVAATRGTAQTFANLAQQSPAYRSGRGSLQEILRSEPHQRRMTLTRARVFEQMKGLSGQVKADMSRVLTDGIGRGLNPLDVARSLSDQIGIEEGRARKIARSEIPTALRRARWDEADEAEELYGLQTKEMHLSALSATTRKTHAARHARLFTREEARDWWSQDGNSIQCKCSTTSVMVDEEGKPLVPGIVDRAKKAKQKMKARGYDWSED